MKNKVNHFLIRYLAVIIWCLIIYYLSDQPDLKSGFAESWDMALRKIAHFLEYAILAALLNWALMLSVTSKKYLLLLTISLAGAFAVSDEWHQTFVNGRVGSLFDVGIDFIGIIFSATILFFKK